MFVSHFPSTEIRYGFGLAYIRDAGTTTEYYDVFGIVEVPVTERTKDALTRELRPWALATLAATKRAFGRYHAGFATLDEDGNLYGRVSDETIDWSGTSELAPIPPPTEAPAGQT